MWVGADESDGIQPWQRCFRIGIMCYKLSIWLQVGFFLLNADLKSLAFSNVAKSENP